MYAGGLEERSGPISLITPRRLLKEHVS